MLFKEIHLKPRYRNAESLKIKKTRRVSKGAPGAAQADFNCGDIFCLNWLMTAGLVYMSFVR